MMIHLRIGLVGVACVIAACDSPRALIAIGDGGVVDVGDDGPVTDGGSMDADEPTDLVSMCGAEPKTLQDWERCYLKRWCEILVNCSELNLYRDVDECVANEDAVEGGQLTFEAFERARAIGSGTASLDTAAFTQCLIETSPRQCATSAHPAVCKRRFVGTVADHQVCFNDIECKSPGAECTQPAVCTDSCCAGTCEPKPKVGEACDDFVDGCEPGIVCGTDDVCVVGDIGSPCAKPYDCVLGGWCDHGTCAPDRHEGESCDSLMVCGGETSCVGLRRPVEPATCRRVTHEGDTCDWYCLGNFVCDLSGTNGFGTCKPIPVHGEPCNSLKPCLGADQVCSKGQCVDRAAAGQACVDGTCLPGLFCTDQVGATNAICKAPLADGESVCNRPSQCQSYVCSGDASANGSCQALQAACP